MIDARIEAGAIVPGGEAGELPFRLAIGQSGEAARQEACDTLVFIDVDVEQGQFAHLLQLGPGAALGRREGAAAQAGLIAVQLAAEGDGDRAPLRVRRPAAARPQRRVHGVRARHLALLDRGQTRLQRTAHGVFQRRVILAEIAQRLRHIPGIGAVAQRRCQPVRDPACACQGCASRRVSRPDAVNRCEHDRLPRSPGPF